MSSLLLLFLTSCGRYADFTLPPAQAAGVGEPYTFEALPDPVLGRGAAGEWNSRDALNPSVVKRDALYYNFYSGFDGRTWHTGLATSQDGLRWTRAGKVLSPDPATWEGNYIAANGSALFEEGRFCYWYQAGPKDTPRLGLAVSGDGRQFRKEPAPVLDTGPRGSWDERGVADPCVIRAGEWLYLYYLGQDRARRQRLGLARSRDGVRWEKLRTNPVLALGGPGAFDENGLGEPAVWEAAGQWWMIYTGRDRAENRRLGLARSANGVAWTKLALVMAGSQAWNNKVICDPSVEPRADGVAVWFGGGDAPSPDENLNGQIGFALLRRVNGNLTR